MSPRIYGTGPNAAHWRGGRTLVKGYWMIYSPDHPAATKQKRVAEHRLVMEKLLGRYLTPREVVHHIDGDRCNNVPENLMVFQTNTEHLKAELKGRVPKWTPEGKASLLRAAKARIKYPGTREERQRESHRQSEIRRTQARRDARQRLLSNAHSPTQSDSNGEVQAS